MTGNYVPTGCAMLAELGPQAAWLQLTTLVAEIALLGAIVGLAVILGFTVLLHRAS